jgi:hypothetical protein
MQILRERPPNFDAIATAFPIVRHRRGIFYAFGDTIYNPDGVEVTPALAAHEATHAQRQRDLFSDVGDLAPDAWWNCYLSNPQFRLGEELIAHRAEWRHFISLGYGRAKRRQYLSQISARLASPLYGGLISAAQAKRAIGAETTT